METMVTNTVRLPQYVDNFENEGYDDLFTIKKTLKE